MYAVFKTGGKQYRAAKGDKLKIEKLDAAEGDSVEFSDVLLVGEGDSVKVGTPLVSGSKVKAKVLAQAKDKKIDVIKFRRRQNYRRTYGHRQEFSLVEITGITGGAAKKKAAAKKPAAKAAKDDKAEKEAEKE
jgi:large subunit ribosomal protein L21